MAKDRQGLHFTELVWESTEQNMEVPPRSSAEAVIPKPPEGPGKKKRLNIIQYSSSYGIWKRRRSR